MCLYYFNKQGRKTLIFYTKKKKTISNVLWLDFVYGITIPKYHKLMTIDSLRYKNPIHKKKKKNLINHLIRKRRESKTLQKV